MDKKYLNRPPSTKAQELAKPNWDFPIKKTGSQFSRKRDNEKFEYGRKPPHHNSRGVPKYARAKERANFSNCKESGSSSEVGSVQRCGSKKQNISHLLNWWDSGPEYYNRNPSGAHDWIGHRYRKPSNVKYNKEHYLLANCQFVVNDDCDLSLYEANPDTFIDWRLVEEVWLRSSETPACPICLHSPVAAKIAKCGHIFCFPCVLHYLALTDRKWQKCPICYDAITQDDLKSVVTRVQATIKCGQDVEMELMRRERASFVAVPLANFAADGVKIDASLADARNNQVFAKFITASANEISGDIVQREEDELNVQMALEGDQPEACFIVAALEIVKERRCALKIPKDQDADASVPEAQLEALALQESRVVGVFDLEEASDGIGAGIASHASPSDGDIADEAHRELDLFDGDIADEAHRELDLFDGDIADEAHRELDLFDGLVDKQTAHINGCKDAGKSVFYFYQEKGGGRVFLHPLNVHMLVKEYGSLELCPRTIKGKVLEKETGSVTEGVRNRFRYLRHLPIACPFEFVELRLDPDLVSAETLAQFQDQIRKRERKRRKRARRESSLEKRAQITHDRLMGKSRPADINTSSFAHFPDFIKDGSSGNLSTDDESLPSSVSSATVDCLDNTPSFAQMIRCGQKKPNAWKVPNQTGARSKAWCAGRDDLGAAEDWERVPDFGASFSDAFAQALDLAAKTALESSRNDGEVINKRGKKGKKKNKGIVLLSSGCR